MWKLRDRGNTKTTKLSSTALRLTIFVDEDDVWHHRPLYTEIVHRAHKAGLAGASVFRGIEGFGASSLIHTTRLLSMTEKLPVAIVIVDSSERIRAFLPQLDELIIEGLVTVEDVEVFRYVKMEQPAESTLSGDPAADSLGASGVEIDPDGAPALG